MKVIYPITRVNVRALNKFKNESAHCVRTDGGKTRRPF